MLRCRKVRIRVSYARRRHSEPFMCTNAAWNGLDTLVVCAGVPTFLPFCELSGLEAHGSTFTPAQADKAAIERAIDTINSVTRTNYIGPAIAAATFVSFQSDALCAVSIELVCSRSRRSCRPKHRPLCSCLVWQHSYPHRPSLCTMHRRPRHLGCTGRSRSRTRLSRSHTSCLRQ